MQVMPVRVTNPNVYTVPDSDSEYESDTDTSIIYFTTRPATSYSSKDLSIIKILEPAMYMKPYMRNNRTRSPETKEQEKRRQLAQKVKERTEKILEEDKKRREKERKEIEKIRASMKATNIFDEDDATFEQEMKQWSEKVEAAIAYDKSRRETELAAEKERAEKEKKEKEEEEKKKQAEKERVEKELKLRNSVATSQEGLEEYKKHFQKIEYFKQNLKPKLQSDSAFRKQIFEARRLVKRTVTQLQYKHNVIFEKYTVMYNHLIAVQGQSQEAFEVLLNFLAKAFLEQVKQEVHATPFAAYFLARFAYLLVSTIPAFLDYLMGRLFKRCPYLIPQYHDDNHNLSDEEIKLRLHYNYTNKDTKTFQTFLQHAEEQKCYVMFYGALCQTEPDPGQPENPYPIKHAWIWLARISNMPPREITPILVMGMLEVAAKRLLEVYPTQTPKLLKLIQTDIIPKYPKREGNDNVAGIKRLEMFLEDYFQRGKLNRVEEHIPPSKY
ncbi:hypothetical protein G6F57_006476 [Rhizopus arrhizus]|uniref:mRNA export factor GLE1 n=1 Tax=Rhizopus oryzae TaxID=64495 RepID=A0A9P6X8F1_RHIOR|nr:hypothetical protein G6F23_004483 [Rhizopus arrhizus]KAG1422167.1 hypothetical protein G6F58_003425 [Rhizopus delemar]KAG0763308.1 hypothetical protein G6F24_006122 [Rhizopus arrhizus]KAG0788656.1 hypothetical protein G6F21_007061 [Rhizopus arrhizus]KAG0799641.1 hypothetical protein G6F22_003024 [Rhizopus arrhizus]